MEMGGQGERGEEGDKERKALQEGNEERILKTLKELFLVTFCKLTFWGKLVFTKNSQE